MSDKILTMKLLDEAYGVCRLDKAELIPEWVKDSAFFSITKTAEELSVVCTENEIPKGITFEKDWRILKVEGPLDFALIGVLASISTILAHKEISIFAISTYDTDYIFVKNKDLDKAIAALIQERYEVIS